MKFVAIDRPGGADDLQVRDVPMPTAGPGQALVRVVAAGVNYIDVYHRTGTYPTDLTQGLGMEGVGEVVALGPDVAGVAVGDTVAWASGRGSYAEFCVRNVSDLIAIPDTVAPETAAAVLLQGLTAHALATDVYAIAPDDPVLVHAAAGGVGLLLTQIATLRGGVVHATASTPTKATAARGAGARFIHDYDGFLDGVLANTPDGVAVAYDGVGAPTVDRSLDSLRPRGVLVVYGVAGGVPGPFDLQRLNAQGSLYVTRPTIMEYTSRPGERDRRTADLFAWIGDGHLDVTIAGRYSLDDVSQAHRQLESRSTIGKLLLVP